jgi:hypothetical protein
VADRQQSVGNGFVLARIAFSLVGVVVLPLAAASVAAGVTAAKLLHAGKRSG